MGAVGVMTEFGSTNDFADLTRLTQLANANLDGWLYWAYKSWHDPTGQPATEGLFARDDDLASLNQAKADVLIQPYPQAVAGIPTSLSWDPAAKVMKLVYLPRAGVGDTDIFVPQRHYPRGYRAIVTGGVVVSAAGAVHLLVRTSPGARQVNVVVQPATGRTGAATPSTPTSAAAAPAAGAGSRLPATGAATWPAAVGSLLLLVAGLGRSRRGRMWRFAMHGA
jgi:endoglycosylceramidase